MSTEMLETVLYRLNVDRAAKRALADDADSWLRETRLHDDEQRLISTFDVRGLLDRGVNPMLVVGYWLECEPSHSLSGYLRRAGGAESSPASSSPASVDRPSAASGHEEETQP